LKFLKSLLIFFVNSNLFIAVCAVVMVCQTYTLFLTSAPDIYFLSFVFFSTICSYSFHWYLTSSSILPSPRIAWTNANRTLHAVLFVIGLAGAGFFFFFLLSHWYWLLLSGIITFLYTAPKIPHPLFRALRKIAFGKTIFLALVWTHVTCILPLLIADEPWSAKWTLFIISRFFLIYAICILFDYRDREDDSVNAVHSLITNLSTKTVFIIFISSIFIFIITTIGMYWFHQPAIHIFILLIPGFITASLFNIAKSNFSDTLYYLILDGQMALSAFILLIPGI